MLIVAVVLHQADPVGWMILQKDDASFYSVCNDVFECMPHTATIRVPSSIRPSGLFSERISDEQ